MLFSRLYNLHGSDEGGAVFIELALVITLLFFVLGGVLDYGFYYREQFTIDEAARFAASTVDYYPSVELPPDPDDFVEPDPRDPQPDQKVVYNRNRFQEGIIQARNYIANAGLNPDGYIYDIWGDSPSYQCDDGGMVNIRIRAKSGANRFTVSPSWAFRTCTLHKVAIEAPMLCHRQGFTKHDGNGVYVNSMPTGTNCES